MCHPIPAFVRRKGLENRVDRNYLKMNLELCTDSVEGAVMAEKHGFKRIELCAALSEGGLTPSFGLIKKCAEATGKVEVHAMIRVRGGSFTCSDPELEVMKEDITQAGKAGAKGVVFGILDGSGEISENNHALVQLAHSLGLQATFHRAFDQVEDAMKAIETLIEMGFDRVLTSGLRQTAIEGIETIRLLNELHGKRIEIMAGSGVNSDNAALLAATGIENLHFTARKSSEEELMDGMGVHMLTDEQKILAIKKALN